MTTKNILDMDPAEFESWLTSQTPPDSNPTNPSECNLAILVSEVLKATSPRLKAILLKEAADMCSTLALIAEGEKHVPPLFAPSKMQ